MDILDDVDLFSDLRNVVVNKDDPFLPYHPPPGKHDELMDADFVHTIYNTKQIGNDTILIPLICYTDKTAVTMNQRIGVEPVLLALGNLSKNARYLYENVRPIGFISNNYVKSTAEKTAESQRKAGKGRSCRNYHACLKQILIKVSDAQKIFSNKQDHVKIWRTC